MKVLSIDVGIKNLAYCLFEKIGEIQIINWDVINIGEQENYLCKEIEKNSICNKVAKYKKNDKCYCLKHSKKQKYLKPTTELKLSSIKKLKIQNLYELADKYKIIYEKPCKKDNLINIIIEYINKNCFENITSCSSNNIDLISIGKIIKNKFDYIFNNIGDIEYIIIENQISPIANRMKTIQGMIAQYFIMKNELQYIEFVSSINKLKEINTTDKLNYNERKKTGINKCIEYLRGDLNYSKWLDFFIKHKKKDDLSDSFLQGIWYIKNKLNNIQQQTF